MLVPGEAREARELKVRRKGNLLKMANPAFCSRAPEHQWNFHGSIHLLIGNTIPDGEPGSAV